MIGTKEHHNRHTQYSIILCRCFMLHSQTLPMDMGLPWHELCELLELHSHCVRKAKVACVCWVCCIRCVSCIELCLVSWVAWSAFNCLLWTNWLGAPVPNRLSEKKSAKIFLVIRYLFQFSSRAALEVWLKGRKILHNLSNWLNNLVGKTNRERYWAGAGLPKLLHILMQNFAVYYIQSNLCWFCSDDLQFGSGAGILKNF